MHILRTLWVHSEFHLISNSAFQAQCVVASVNDTYDLQMKIQEWGMSIMPREINIVTITTVVMTVVMIHCFSEMVVRCERVTPYFQTIPLSSVLTITNPRRTTSRIRACRESKSWIYWMKLISRDNQCTGRKSSTMITIIIIIQLKILALKNHEKWREFLDNCGETSAVLTDLSKAFDCINVMRTVLKKVCFILSILTIPKGQKRVIF